MRTCIILLALGTSGLCAAGCSPFGKREVRSYTTVVADAQHDAAQARVACDRAAKHFQKGNLAKAEADLQEALIADVSFAPAHNNLGHVYFQQGRLYLAAWEFEYARRLLPGSAEVNNNLGMVYEAAEQLPRAVEYYRMALSMDEGNPEYVGNLARALVRTEPDSPEIRPLLQCLAFNDSRPEWVVWAKDQLNLEYLSVPAGAPMVSPRVPPGATLPEEVSTPPAGVELPPPPHHVDDLLPLEESPINLPTPSDL
jgi:tetratricopeptide (TPR) repeat protein